MKRKNLVCWVAFFFAMLSALPAWGQSFPATPELDDFSGDLSSWTDGVSGTGTCTISGGGVTGGSGTDDCYWTSTFNVTQEVYATMSNGSSFAEENNQWLFVCIQNVGASFDAYGIRARRRTSATDLVQMARFSGGSQSNLGTADTSIEFADGDQIGMRIESDGTLTAYLNDGGGGWTQIDQVTDTNHTCTSTNIGLQATQVIWDDFGGGAITSSNNLLGQPPIFFD